MRERIVLVDSVNQFLRNYAVRPTLDKNGCRNGGTFGMLSSLGHFCKVLEPTKMILCWDGSGGSKKRRNLLPEYKHGRKAARPARINSNYDFEHTDIEQNKINQRIRLAEYLENLPIQQVVVEDTEADDVIAYLAGLFKEQEVAIVSTDKDFFQLLDQKTIVYQPTKKFLYTKKTLVDEYHIYPHNWALARSITGDSGDNVIGVDRVGLKNLLKYFPFMSEEPQATIDDIFQFSSQQILTPKGKKYQKFIDEIERIKLNYKVVQLKEPIISYSSIASIHEQIEKPVGLNATAIRSKFMIDGIESLGDNFFFRFKEILFRSERNVKV